MFDKLAEFYYLKLTFKLKFLDNLFCDFNLVNFAPRQLIQFQQLKV